MEDDSLDKVETIVEGESSSGQPVPQGTSQPRGPLVTRKRLLLVVGLIVIILGAALVAMLLNRKPVTTSKQTTTVTITTQSLDNGTLNKLSTQAGSGGNTTQLTITPQTLFKNGIIVQGAATIEGNLAIHGSLSVTGALSATSLNVGSLVVTDVSASGNLQFGGHIIPNGATPGAKPSNGTSGGTVTVNGNDTAGTVTITIGNGILVAGEMAIITFHTPFGSTPKVQLTPLSPTSAALNYYATRSPNFFTIETGTTPTAGATYIFDYLVTQ